MCNVKEIATDLLVLPTAQALCHEQLIDSESVKHPCPSQFWTAAQLADFQAADQTPSNQHGMLLDRVDSI